MARPKDTTLFINTLMECGGRASNAKLQSQLGWLDEKYWKMHRFLFDAGQIEKGKGYSGTVIIVPGEPVVIELEENLNLPISVTAQSPVDADETPLTEDQLYAPAQKELAENWSIRHSLDSIHVENIAKQGRRETGGSWTRPDLALIALKTFEYLPERIFEIHTFEIKASYDVTVKGVMEALSHREAATRSYVIYHTNGLDLVDYPEATRIENLAIKHGIGVIAAKNIFNFNEWADIVPAIRSTPDPDDMETFIKRSLSDEAKSKIRKWLK